MKKSSFFKETAESKQKILQLKKNIVRHYVLNGECTIADLSQEMDLSIPTVTKLVCELIIDGVVQKFGKQGTNGGRRPNIYGLRPNSVYFMGVDIRQSSINMSLINLGAEEIYAETNIPFCNENTQECLAYLCKRMTEFIKNCLVKKEKIINICVNISGRINTFTGESYSFFHSDNHYPLAKILSEKIGIRVIIDNDSRAMAYGEFMSNLPSKHKNMLFINISWGLGLGMILDGNLYYGKSGFSGEFGHQSVFDNEIICRCGKKGCLETEASGSAICRKLIQKVKNGNCSILEPKIKSGKNISLEDILESVKKEDVLSIELIEETGNILGKQISGLINIFNPDLVVIGGSLAAVGDYLLLPIRTNIKKYSLNMVSKDTDVIISKLKDRAGVIGACMLARSRIIGLL